jgi:hypothetical protein
MNPNPKPFVRYIPAEDQFIRVGFSACVFPIDHTSELVSNKIKIITSIVGNYNKESGRFETQNTVYIPTTK